MATKIPKPIIAISSCLLGKNVRYDGTNKRNELILNKLPDYFELRAECPEMAIGLGVPRAPIQMVMLSNELRLLGVDAPERDVTVAMQAHAKDMITLCADISGYIFKSRSPSCGLEQVPVLNSRGELVQYSDGFYAGMIRSAYPQLPIIDEQALGSTDKVDEFIDRVQTYHQSKHN